MLSPRTQRNGSQAGITLIELLITLVILSIVSTMLIGTWISLQRAYAFASAKNTATATARDALDRVSSEIRDAQGVTYSASPSPSTSTPFYFGGTSPYVCDANDCVFYSAFNNPNAVLQSGQYGRDQLRLTAIWLDTSGTQAQKTLYWQRDTNGSGTFDSGDRKVILARNVVNSAAAVNKPIFTYVFRGSSGTYTTSTSLTAGNVATLTSVQVDIIVDANLSHTPTYIDLRTTVEPRNLGSL
jgi:prepilin-type N-terminal cleavage/methylation domain-containing protein